MATVNNIRLLIEDFSESRVVEKVITTFLEKFESKISSFEDSRDFSGISLFELINSLYALEQRRANRYEDHPKGAFQAKAKEDSSSSQKGKKPWLDKREKPMRDAEKVCKNKGNSPAQQQIQAQATEDLQAQEEHVFTALCFATSNKARCNWLVDSGCTHHMATDEKLFKDFDRTFASKIRIGNRSMIEAKGRGNVLINPCSGNKVISDVLFVPDIDQDLLSVGQLVEKGYSLAFKNGTCIVKTHMVRIWSQ
ncbi:uncharacterized protein LOC108472265 [Gossypium arboreum]|uniref:uncharacterized protein LOC108472265 n=1 Tax=Gossypium arboreum TaxID=29729 RepID=UPI0008191817|nr:uncharacterized protein LOC108472265 [Gossypium arboreum]